MAAGADRRLGSRRWAIRLGVLGVGAIAAAGATSATAAGGTAPVTAAPTGSVAFDIYHPDDSSPGAHTADEPSIGSDWKTGAAMYLADTHTYRVTFDDTKSPPAATWTEASAPLTSVASLDPILFTDATTGRTFVSQLDVACSLTEYSDDDGANWIPSEGCGPNGIEDHQSVGGGPFHAPVSGPPSPAYQHAVYYCNQDFADSTFAYCALSVDGGLTFTPGVPIYNFTQCGGLHGHLRVAPDGTAVIPNQNCAPTATNTGPPGMNFPNQAAVVTTTNGAAWAVQTIPGSTSTLRSDPSVAFDAAGTMYFGMENGVFQGNDVSKAQIGGTAMIATSKDEGKTWSPLVDVGAPFGIQNVTFPEVIAGDAGRAAFAFLGSSTPGNPEDTAFQGFWYLYTAITTDGGSTWTVSNLTPNDPVERACIFLAGNGSCPSKKRNLLDFMDITVDNHGRVLIGYADGCTGACVTEQNQPCTDTPPICATGSNASVDRLSSIARETCGPSLLAQYDSANACAPAAAVPEAPWAPATVLLGAIGVTGAWWRARRRGGCAPI